MAGVPTLGSVSQPRSHGYDGYIGNILIRLAVSKENVFETATAEAQAPRIDTADTAEDIRDEVGQRYSRSNLSGGAGMDFLHSPRRPSNSATRYWDSEGVDVFGADKGEAYAATLMHEMLLEEASANIVRAVQIDGTVYYVSGTGIYQGSTLKDTLSATGVDMVAMGNSLYSMDATDGVQRYDPPSWTPTNVSTTTTFTRIWGVKGRIVGIIDNLLYEAGVSDTLLLTLTPEDTVTDVVDTGAAILVFTTTGTIYSMTVSDALVMSVTGESSFIDEIPVRAAYVFGILGIVTAEATVATGRVARFYTAAVNSNFEVVDLQLVWQLGDRDTTENLTPTAILATRDSIYVSVPDEGLETATLWRFYLPTYGYARSYQIGMTTRHAVNSLVQTDDRMWAGVTSEGLWMEQDTYVDSGYIVGPLADFFTAEPKQWVTGEITGTAPSTTELVLKDSNDIALLTTPASGSWQYITRINSSSDPTVSVDMVGKTGRYHLARIGFYADAAGTYTPSWWSYSFRAMPSPDRDQLFRLPINISDQIEAPGRRAVTVDGRGEALRTALMAYEGVDALIEIWRPARKIQGIIERFEEPIYTIPKRGSVGKVMYARIRGKQLSLAGWTATPTLGSSLGQDGLGLSTLGVGDPT